MKEQVKQFAETYLQSLGYKGCDDFFSSADVPQEIVFDMMKAFALSVVPVEQNDDFNSVTLMDTFNAGFNECRDQIKKNIG